MTLSVETLAEAIHSGRSGIPWKVTSQQDLAFRDARAVLTAIEQAGYVVVPREATPEMIQNAWNQIDWGAGFDPRDAGFTSTFDDVRDAYDAALSAAPKIQHSEGE